MMQQQQAAAQAQMMQMGNMKQQSMFASALGLCAKYIQLTLANSNFYNSKLSIIRTIFRPSLNKSLIVFSICGGGFWSP